jgi:hypothetical protein
MSETYERVKLGTREAPASFHDAMLKLRDATGKGWISLDSDGRYVVDKNPHKIYCAVGYLLPPEYRRKLVDSDKYVNELPKVLGVERHLLEMHMGVTLEDAQEIQTKFDDISRRYLTEIDKPYTRQPAKHEARRKFRKEWVVFLDSLFERENYTLE